jgi:hypothetical protein
MSGGRQIEARWAVVRWIRVRWALSNMEVYREAEHWVERAHLCAHTTPRNCHPASTHVGAPIDPLNRGCLAQEFQGKQRFSI